MNIALFTTDRTTIPPEKGIVAASADLTAKLADGLVDKGHTVTLYGAKGSVSKAHIIDLDLPSSRLDYSLHPYEWVKNMNIGMKQLYLSELYKHSSQYDIIHLQTEPVYLGMPFAHMSTTPTVVTNHNPFLQEEKSLLMFYKDIPIITISQFQRNSLPELNHIATVYDGVPLSDFQFSEGAEGKSYLSFMGRLVAEKGVQASIDTSVQSHIPLKISGVGSEKFIHDTISPHISDHIQFTGPLNKNSEEWNNHLGKAKALLSPIEWEEPFGLVMVEAMAFGTPVIAYSRGSVPEIVVDGVTGYIVNPSEDDRRGEFQVKQTGIAGLTEAVGRIFTLSEQEYRQMRMQCRAHVEQKFSMNAMITGYEDVYKRLLAS